MEYQIIRAETESAKSKLKAAKIVYRNATAPLEAALKEAKQKSEVVRWRVYLEAYEGPTSENADVMSKLLNADRLRCQRRFK